MPPSVSEDSMAGKKRRRKDDPLSSLVEDSASADELNDPNPIKRQKVLDQIGERASTTEMQNQGLE